MQKLTWPAVGLVIGLGLIVVALAALTDMGSSEILGVIGVLGGIGGGAAVAGGMSGRVDDVHAETTAQTAQLTTIERRVNGDLDARIAAGMEEAAETGAARALAALRDQGLIT